MILKNKRYLKLFICLMLSCSLCVSAPLAKYQRIETHAAIAVPIAIGAGTIALMYLAACGVSYIFQGMTQADAEDWIDTKIIEFSSLSDGNGGTNGNMPNGSGNWKMTALGALLIGSTLSNWLSRFASWIVGNQQDNSEDILYSGDSYIKNTKIQVVNITKNNSVARTLSLDNSFYAEGSTVGEKYYFSDDESVYLQVKSINNAAVLFGIYSNDVDVFNQYVYNMNNLNAYINRAVTLVYNIATNKYQCVFFSNPRGSYDLTLQQLWSETFSLDVPMQISENSITQKTETVSIPQEIVNNYYYTINPDVQTTTQDLDGVPVPLSADDIADAVWEKISMNTSATTVYQPELLPAADGFSEQANINTDDYDEPLPEPEPEPQPDWDSMNAGDVPAFTQSVWNYFMQNHNWSQLKQKFPFSLPYDAYLIANIFFDTSYDVMDELPQDGNNNRLIRSSTAPVYTLSIPWGYGDPYTLVLDFSLLDSWQSIIRAAAGVLFTVALIVGVL